MNDRQQLIDEIKAHSDTKKAQECIRLLKETKFNISDIKAIWKGRV